MRKNLHSSVIDNSPKLKVKSETEVAQSCWTLSDPMDCSPPGSSIHGIFQAGVLEWSAIAFSIWGLDVHFFSGITTEFTNISAPPNLC